MSDILNNNNNIPNSLKEMFIELKENEFRLDISSTELRKSK